MADNSYSIVMRDASLLDIEDFKKEIAPKDIKIVSPGQNKDSHEELTTLLILTLGPAALAAFTIWALRDTDEEDVDYSATVRKPDGTETTVHLKIRRSSSKAPDAQVIQQIAEALKVPESVILSATAT